MKIYGVKSKKGAAMAVKKFVVFLLSHGRIPRLVRTDAGSVERGAEFAEDMALLGLRVVTNPAKEPLYQLERVVQTINNDIGAVLKSTANFGATDWLACAKAAAMLRNTMPHASSLQKSEKEAPHQLVPGAPFDMRTYSMLSVGNVVVAKTQLVRRRWRGARIS